MNYEQHLLILRTVESLKAAGGPAPCRTLIQKTLFIANELYDLQLPFTFILYKHGPYSFDVDNAIEEMRSYKALRIDPITGYGVMIRPDEGKRFTEEYGTGIDARAIQSILVISDNLANKMVKELERIATAVWIYYRYNIHEPDEIANNLRILKPHVGDPEARDAVQKMQALQSAMATTAAG